MEKTVRRKPSENSILTLTNRSDILFVTVCTRNRGPLLANDDMCILITEAWAAAVHWLVGRYVIMPDHIHFFCSPNTTDPNLKAWIAHWKRLVTQSDGSEARGFWQSGFWDTQIRTGKAYEEKWQYVRHNPVRKGLAVVPEEWPYQGELNELRWFGP